MAASAYHFISKETENRVFRNNRIFRHTLIYKQPILTKKGNYNNFLQILHSYLRYIDRILDVFFFLLAVILSELYQSSKKKTDLQKKLHRRICVRDITFLAARPLSYVIFRLLPNFRLLRFYVEKKILLQNFYLLTPVSTALERQVLNV